MPDYIRTDQRRAALERLNEANSRAVVLGPRPEPWPYTGADTLVDLSALNLAYITSAAGEIHLGALTPLSDLAQAPVILAGPAQVLAEAASLAAQPGLLRVATLAGALRSDRGAPELRLALLVLDATIVVETVAGSARLDMRAPIPADALLIEVVLRQPSGGAALARVARTPRDLAIVAALARVEIADGVCRAARLAIAGVGAPPARVAAAAQSLEGRPLTTEALDAAAQAVAAVSEPVADFRGSADYRRALAGVLTRRALAAAAASA